MAITFTYPVATPKASDLIIGTQTPDPSNPASETPTRNFTIQSIMNLVGSEGTVNTIPMFSNGGLIDSVITQNAGNVGIDGTVIIRTTGSVDNLKIVSTDTSTGGAPDIVLLADVPAVTGDSHGDILFQGQNGMVPGSGNVLTYTGLFSKMVDKDNNHSSLVMTTHKGNGSGAQALTATFSAKGTNNAATGTLLINPSSVTEVASYNLDVNGDARITGALVDSSANAGTAGQVLSSTVTGIAWIPNNAAPAYTSSFIKVFQSGTGEPTLTFISNDAGLVLGTDTRVGTGQYYFTFTGSPPDKDDVMIVLPGGLKNGQYSLVTLVSEYRNSGQLFINSYGVNGSGALIPTDIGFGGSNSFIAEIKVFS